MWEVSGLDSLLSDRSQVQRLIFIGNKKLPTLSVHGSTVSGVVTGFKERRRPVWRSKMFSSRSTCSGLFQVLFGLSIS